MNAQDRRKAARLNLTAQKALGILDELRTAIGELGEAEEVKFENMCERGLEDSALAQGIEEAQCALEEAYSEIDEAHSSLENAIITLEGVSE